MSKATNRRNIEGSGKATTQRQGKEKVPATRAPVVELRLGTAIANEIIAMMGEKSGLRLAILKLKDKSAETCLQAVKEIRNAQYKLQAAVAGIEWNKDMKPEDFMDSKHKGGSKYKQQRSISANFSRTISIVSRIAGRKEKGLSCDKIFECTDIARMYAMLSPSGSASDPEKLKLKPLSDQRFNVLEITTERLIAPDALKDGDKVAMLEKHIMHVLRLAQKASLVLSDEVKAALGIKETRARRVRAA